MRIYRVANGFVVETYDRYETGDRLHDQGVYVFQNLGNLLGFIEGLHDLWEAQQ